MRHHVAPCGAMLPYRTRLTKCFKLSQGPSFRERKNNILQAFRIVCTFGTLQKRRKGGAKSLCQKHVCCFAAGAAIRAPAGSLEDFNARFARHVFSVTGAALRAPQDHFFAAGATLLKMKPRL